MLAGIWSSRGALQIQLDDSASPLPLVAVPERPALYFGVATPLSCNEVFSFDDEAR